MTTTTCLYHDNIFTTFMPDVIAVLHGRASGIRRLRYSYVTTV